MTQNLRLNCTTFLKVEPMGSHKKQPISSMVADSLSTFFGCVDFFVAQNRTFHGRRNQFQVYPQVEPFTASCLVFMGTNHSKVGRSM